MAPDKRAQKLAESICERVTTAPWELHCFIRWDNSNARFQLDCFKPNDPALARYESNRRGVLVGVYNRHCVSSDVLADVLAAING